MIFYNVGRREVGKTTLAYYLVSKQMTRIIFDPRGQFPTSARVETSEAVIAAFDALYERGSGEIVISPEHDIQGLFELTSREVKRWIRDGRNVAYLVDEVSLIDPSPRPGADEFDWILRLCPRRQAIIVITGHRPTDLPTKVRAIMDFWLLFQMTLENDLEVVEKKCGRTIRDELVRLQPYQFIVWDDSKATASTNKNSAAWYLRLTDHSGVSAVHAPDLTGDPIRKHDTGGLLDDLE